MLPMCTIEMCTSAKCLKKVYVVTRFYEDMHLSPHPDPVAKAAVRSKAVVLLLLLLLLLLLVCCLMCFPLVKEVMYVSLLSITLCPF